MEVTSCRDVIAEMLFAEILFAEILFDKVAEV